MAAKGLTKGVKVPGINLITSGPSAESWTSSQLQSIAAELFQLRFEIGWRVLLGNSPKYHLGGKICGLMEILHYP